MFKKMKEKEEMQEKDKNETKNQEETSIGIVPGKKNTCKFFVIHQ